MTTLAQLKHKYSGQTVPEWELAQIKAPETVPVVAKSEKPKRQPRKTEETIAEDPVSDGDSVAD